MLKIGDKCIWAPRAIRRMKNGEDKAICRKQVLTVKRISADSPYRVMLDEPTWKEWVGWYRQRDLIKI